MNVVEVREGLSQTKVALIKWEVHSLLAHCAKQDKAKLIRDHTPSQTYTHCKHMQAYLPV